jgi:hypothetical protein|tara:strand:+ start:4640 stop:5806 length:1167 start_codon:yes stop_codon:yes gene_type:complete
MPSHIPQYGTFFEFKKDDVFHNTLKTYPRVNFYVYSGSVYYNNENNNLINFHTPKGHINLYDLNVNRNNVSSSGDPQLIYPFITKNGSSTSFSTVSKDNFNLDFAYGDEVTGSYPLTASISIDQFGTSLTGRKKDVLYSLKNTLDFYTTLSPHFAYSSSFGIKEEQKINMISIPSIFYGSSIEKGSVRLKYYVTGTLIAEAADTLKNGVLSQTSGSATGTNIGVVLYNEGFILLTASTDIDTHTEAYTTTSTAHSASWQYFGVTGSYAGSPSSSFSLDFNGVNHVQTMTFFAHAKENQINFSNNPTFLSGAVAATSGSNVYHEDAEMNIKNIVTSSYKNYTASFQPVTYISKVAIYDDDKNLIGIASLANPVRKLEDRSYTFKLKLDI